ncbi:DUF3558 domain-containing protein [Nocardia suismassiliense]|uniref:DUF3558 domain-containing protein n=1 Tax=Nocardia suismassiliense TaxID=2077092 RepID=UPI000D1EFFB9|nr:DUF3558 domain-containing protein [Nocardia suismassiliense]
MRTAIVSPKVAVRTVLAGVAVVGFVVGCSPTEEGTPTTEVSGKPTSGEPTVQYNPCTDLSDDALRTVKVDVASKKTVTDAPSGPVTWRMCQWASTDGPYAVTVGASTHTLDEARKNDTVTGFRDVKVGPRAGLIYQDKADENKLRCYVSMPSSTGMFVVIVGWFYGQRASLPQAPPCDLAAQHAAQLEPYLPK